MSNGITGLQNVTDKAQHLYKRLVGPIISIILPAALLGVVIYFVLGGVFDVGDLADDNNVVRIPLVLIIVALPIGWLIDAVGVTAGVAIICAVLGLWMIGGIVSLVRRIKGLKTTARHPEDM